MRPFTNQSRTKKREMTARSVDYSLYLVTDSGMLPDGVSMEEQVEKAIAGGVTIVQLREKSCDTRQFIALAERVHEVTQKHGVPLLINDRVDVALAAGCEGVHVGQDDMPVELVRKLLGPDKIVGLSVGSVDEAQQAVKHKGLLDYIGIGPVFPTATKKNLRRDPFGPLGAQQVLQVLADKDTGHQVKAVVIGGIKDHNLARVLYTCGVGGRGADGVAVVSELMTLADPQPQAEKLLGLVKRCPPGYLVNSGQAPSGSELTQNVVASRPLVHHITNNVVKNLSANIALAVGASPVMSEEPRDFKSFATVPNSACVVNIGMTSSFTQQLPVCTEAVKLHNLAGNPVVLDPVGAGATEFRRLTVLSLLSSGYFTVVKGNQSEIVSIANGLNQQRGVDNCCELSEAQVIAIGKSVALRLRAIVVMTGETDLIIDGCLTGEYPVAKDPEQAVVKVKGGHPIMGAVTGTGCSLGSVIAAFVSANRNCPFLATVQAVQLYKSAGTLASKVCNGPGSFVPEFIDQLYKLSHT